MSGPTLSTEMCLANGKLYHLGTVRGDIANRIITVGSHSRADKFARLLDDSVPVHTIRSSRGFCVHSGTYKGVPVTLIGTGMGVPMMDFMVRESLACVDGDVAYIRFGTCGGCSTNVKCGDVGVASLGAAFLARNPNAFGEGGEDIAPYQFFKPAPCTESLAKTYKSNLVAQLGADRVKDVLDVTCDTFYASQAWPMRDFEDRNTTLLNDMKQAYEGQDLICEMETFHLYDLARCCRTRKMFVAAAAIVVDNQEAGAHEWLSPEEVHAVEDEAAVAVLDTIISQELDAEMPRESFPWLPAASSS